MTKKVNRQHLKPGPKPKVDIQKAQEATSLLRSGKLFNEASQSIGVCPKTLRMGLVAHNLKLPHQILREKVQCRAQG